MGSTFGNSVKTSGNALIIVLTISLTIGLIVLLSLETNVLLSKIMKTYQQDVSNFIAAEKALLEAELRLQSHTGNKADTYFKIQFVPDSVAFAERQGIDFYQLEVEHVGAGGAQTHLQSIMGVRH